MQNKAKEKLYISGFVITTLALYILPFILLDYKQTIRDELLHTCLAGEGSWFSFCWEKAKEDSALAIWHYLLPFMPISILLWVFWIADVRHYRMSKEQFPTKTAKIINWVAVVIAILASLITIGFSFQGGTDDFEAFVTLPWLAICILSASMLFIKFLSPKNSNISLTWVKRSLYLAAITPLLKLIIVLIKDFE